MKISAKKMRNSSVRGRRMDRN